MLFQQKFPLRKHKQYVNSTETDLMKRKRGEEVRHSAGLPFHQPCVQQIISESKKTIPDWIFRVYAYECYLSLLSK